VTPICYLLLLAAPPEERPLNLRYLRPAGDKWVTESEVRYRPGSDLSLYSSETTRPDGETLLLRIKRVGGRTAEAIIQHDKGGDRKTAQVTWDGDTVKLSRGGKTENLKVPPDPVITSAPDWSDILALVRRYDRKKGDKQEFPGLWFHPTQPHRILAFSVEGTGSVRAQHEGKPLDLQAFKITIRSGGYKVWALPTGEVVKILPDGPKATPVVLEGYTETTKGLR
jgi:hypothetical protein